MLIISASYPCSCINESSLLSVLNPGNGNAILRRTTKKKMKHRGGPEKTKNNNNGSIDFMKDYGSYDDCSLNIPKDLKCGCTGNLNEGCFIF